MSLAYHPQPNVQIEAVNKTLEMKLWCFCGDCPKNWCKWIPWMEFKYNTSQHSSSKCPPLQPLYNLLYISYMPSEIPKLTMQINYYRTHQTLN